MLRQLHWTLPAQQNGTEHLCKSSILQHNKLNYVTVRYFIDKLREHINISIKLLCYSLLDW